jgi:hypothetical protein
MLVHEDAGSSIREPSDDVEKRRRRVLLPMAPHACGFSLRLQSGQHSLETTQRSRQIANQSRRDGRKCPRTSVLGEPALHANAEWQSFKASLILLETNTVL